ncbi:MAG: ACT domain-containing protein [Anaerolineae bacterium]|nr:ACT domain-containing protein [Anaerolineae bacterium]
MHEAIRAALAAATLYTDDREYCLIHLPARAILPAAAVLAESAESFSALIVDKDEVTLVLSAERLEDFSDRLPGHEATCGYHLLTFDLPLEHNLIGFLSVVSRELAAAGVSIMALSAYERDHLLIPDAQLETAIIALNALKDSAATPGT